MNRLAFGIGLGAELGGPVSAKALQERAAKRVGVLSPPDPFTAPDAIRNGLRDLGWTETDAIR